MKKSLNNKKLYKLRKNEMKNQIFLFLGISLLLIILVGSDYPNPSLGTLEIKDSTILLPNNSQINLVSSTYSFYSKQAITNNFKVYFRNNSNQAEPVRFEKDGYYFIYDISGSEEMWRATPSQPSASSTLGGGVSSNSQDSKLITNGNEIIYSGAWQNTNVSYEIYANKIKENFILYSLPSIKDYLYLEYSGNIKFNKSLNICANGICYTPSGTEDDFNTTGQIDFRDSNNITRFYLQAPVITDSAGHTTKGIYFVHGSNAQMNFWLRIPTTFLQTAVYPIFIDPTIGTNVTAYQDINTLEYSSDWFDVNVTLFKKINGEYSNTINDIFVYYNNDSYKFGANDTINSGIESYKYLIKSDGQIYQDNFKLYISRDINNIFNYFGNEVTQEHHVFDFSDICNKNFECSNQTILDESGNDYIAQICNKSADCQFNYIDDYNLEIIFNSDKEIDPLITITSPNVFEPANLQTNITYENNFSHLTIDNTLNPYINLTNYYSFDVNTTKSHDYTVNDRDCTLTNPPTFTNCLFGNCYSFDGANDVISCGTNPALNTSFSVSAWVYPIQVTATGAYIVTKFNTGSTAGWGIYLVSDASGYNSTRFFYTGTLNLNKWGATNTIAWNQWNHVVVTYNGSNQQVGTHIYRNGAEISYSAQSSNGSGRTSVSTNTIYIGNRADVARDFNGSIDEVMIFDKELNSTEITAIYNNQSSRFKKPGQQTLKQINITSGYSQVGLNLDGYNRFFGTNISARLGAWDVSLGYNNSDFSGYNGLVAYWNLDSNNGTANYTNDSSGNGNTGQCFNMGDECNFTSGVYNNGINFDGVNDYVNISASSSINSGNVTRQLTWGAWINARNVTNGYGGIISTLQGYNGPGGFFMGKRVNSGEVFVCSIGNLYGTQGVNLESIQINSWRYYICVYNGTDVLSYVNGVYQSRISGLSGIDISKGNLFVGAGYNDGSQNFNGSIDEVMVFNRSLSADEVKELYTKGRALWNYTEYQNLTEINSSTPSSLNIFNISTTTTNILTDFLFISDPFNFYTPNLKTNLGLRLISANPGVFYINIIYPLKNGSYANVSNLTFTTDGLNLDSCWYSNSSGIWNSTPVSVIGLNPNFNYTFMNVNTTIGRNNFTVYCNSANNVNSTQVTFFVDSIAPVFTNLRNFSHLVNTSFSQSITGTDTNTLTYSLNQTNYFNINSSTGLITNATNLSRIEIHWLNISVNDTAGNKISGVFYINVSAISDNVPPNLIVNYPINGSTYGFNGPINLTLNVTANDTSGISSMWYSLDNGITNVTFMNLTGIILSVPEGTSKDFIINVGVNDSYNNINSTSVYVILSQSISPSQSSSNGGGSISPEIIPVFNITITPHYYLQGYELQSLYKQNQTYDGILFEVTGINGDYKTYNISIFETYPNKIINFTNLLYNQLKSNEKKILARTNVIPIEEFNEPVFSIALIGIDDLTKKQVIAYSKINFESIQKKQLQIQLLDKIGNSIWEGEPVKGIYLGLMIIAIIGFIVWKYEATPYLKKSITNPLNRYRRKERYERLHKNEEKNKPL